MSRVGEEGGRDQRGGMSHPENPARGVSLSLSLGSLVSAV